jgi:hypothetical protein
MHPDTAHVVTFSGATPARRPLGDAQADGVRDIHRADSRLRHASRMLTDNGGQFIRRYIKPLGVGENGGITGGPNRLVAGSEAAARRPVVTPPTGDWAGTTELLVDRRIDTIRSTRSSPMCAPTPVLNLISETGPQWSAGLAAHMRVLFCVYFHPPPAGQAEVLPHPDSRGRPRGDPARRVARYVETVPVLVGRRLGTR